MGSRIIVIVKAIISGTVIAFALLVSCAGGPPQTKEAVREAMIKHISKRSDMTLGSMDIDVSAVTFKEGVADATVTFSVKGGAPGAAMSMPYQLEAKGKEWVVKSRSEKGGAANPHGGGMPDAGAMPQGGSGAMPSPEELRQSMPPEQVMPPGHPSVEKKK